MAGQYNCTNLPCDWVTYSANGGPEIPLLAHGEPISSQVNCALQTLYTLAQAGGGGGGGTDTLTVADNGDGTSSFTHTAVDGTPIIIRYPNFNPGVPLPQADGVVECNAGALTLEDRSTQGSNNMVFGGTPISAFVSDGVIVAPTVTGALNSTLTLNTAGLNGANDPWTVTQIVTASVDGNVVSKTSNLEISPCV